MKSLSNLMEKELLKVFSKHYGKSQTQLIKEFKLPVNEKASKNIRSLIVNSILNKEKCTYAEDKIRIKTITINNQGTPMQSMSFPQIKYTVIVKEEWENSEFFKILSSDFLFVIFKVKNAKDENPILSKVKFWKMNEEDLKIASNFWELTKDNIVRGEYKKFITIKNDFICHVRTKGGGKKDLMKTPQGTMETKKGYWLNASYIKTQI